MKKWLARAAAWLEELLFPECVSCICCGQALGKTEEMVCAGCERMLDHLAAKEEKRHRIRTEVPGLEEVLAAYPYEGLARRLVLKLKFKRVRAAAVPLAKAMSILPVGEADVLIPIPTTKKRERRRGFNQAALLSEHLAKTWGMPMEESLVRQDERAAQSTLSAKQRQKNLKGCMQATKPMDGMRVLLVDDVYTTGATAQEAARALLEAGAKSVRMLAATRSMGLHKGKRKGFLSPAH